MKTSLQETGSQNYSTELACLACGRLTENGNTFHHIKTQKAHPEFASEEWNLMPLCKGHHAEVHNVGLKEFASKYKKVHLWLIDHNWYPCLLKRTWDHDPEVFEMPKPLENMCLELQ